jgi:hypothetical protein
MQTARMTPLPFAVVAAAALVTAAVGTPMPRVSQTTMPPRTVGNESCRPCHATVVETYSRTAMARTSGPAYPALEGTFRHAQSGVSYRVFRSGRAAFLSYDRRGDRPLHGVQELKYHVGSNTPTFGPWS